MVTFIVHLCKSTQRTTLLVLVLLLTLSAYLLGAANTLFLSLPAHHSHPPPSSPHHLHAPADSTMFLASTRRPKSPPAAQVQLNTPQELAVVTAFLVSLLQNVIPGSANPLALLDPELILDFDMRGVRAKEEVLALMEDMWEENLVVLYAKFYSLIFREIKAILKSMHITPSPTVFDVDLRDNAEILTPLLQRLTPGPA
jgi:hypothetical protein